MYIKQVIVEGFKTYKERTVIDPFHKGHNVVLGKNGSGKSNIYDAIQFVLSDKFSGRTEDRRKLLHEGSGREIMTASVEIIFDNSDSRFPVDKPEISLKRTIGLKKDEYFLDNKHMTKTDVVNLLESAGLSRSNPYYIVQQGQVRRLITMKDSERLETLKEIAGTRTYDDRRKESLKIMKDTDSRTAHINEVVSYIEKRLAELEEEKKELKEYQKLDSDRRCLEYTVYDAEMRKAAEELEEVETMRAQSSESTEDFHVDAQAAQKKRQDAEDELKQVDDELTAQAATKKRLHTDRRQALQKRAALELKVKAGREALGSATSERAAAEKELKALASRIATTRTQLEEVTADFAGKVGKEEETAARLQTCEARLVDLYAKQGRSSQFKTQDQRDRYLKKQIKDAKANLKKEENQSKALHKARAAAEAEATQTNKLHAKAEAEVKKVTASIEAVGKRLGELKEERDEATNARKELWRKEAGMDKGMASFQTQLAQAEKQLQYTMSKDVWKGLQAMRHIVKEERLKGVHGPLIELFTCGQEEFQRCVETTGGNSLFHVVVDDEAIAARIIKKLNRIKGGRVTFMPLSQLTAKDIEYPRSIDVIPMVDKLTYDKKYHKAILQVFGKTVITRDLTVATQYARTHNLNTITLAGDQVNKKGALTGGFIDNKRSRLAAQARIAQLKSQFSQSEAEELKRQVAQKDQQVTRTLGEIQKQNEKRKHLRSTLQQHRLELQALARQRKVHEEAQVGHDKALSALEATTLQLEQQLESLQEELASDLLEDLNSQDQNELHETNSEVTTLKEALLKAQQSRAEAETRQSTLQNLLDSNLLRREAELQGKLQQADADAGSDQLEADAHELATLTDAVEELDSQVKELEATMDQRGKRGRELRGQLDDLKDEEARKQRALAKRSKGLERLLGRRAGLLQKKDDCHKKIRDLGSLPADISKYRAKTVAFCMKRLEKINQKLKKYSHVNKKAIDQFMSFTEQRQDLGKRKAELDKGRKAIMELIDHLDRKKDEAIERTFKGIAKHFSSVFSELVPGGKGTLVIQASKGDDEDDEEKSGLTDDEDDDEEEEEEEGSSSSSSKKRKKQAKKKGKKKQKVGARRLGTKHYTGVGIKVSFTGGHQTMHQLSGGQQSVVALSLVFAIQRCDPSPFYLFDEIDSNLDAVHRAAVARMVHKQSETTQFITTTFRDEMLKTANKFYGVAFVNKMSKVSVISRKESQQLIYLCEQEEKDKAKRAQGRR